VAAALRRRAEFPATGDKQGAGAILGGLKSGQGGTRLRHVSGAVRVVRALVAVLLAGVVSAVAAAQGLPIENIQLRGDRFPGLHYRDMTPEQRALLYNVVNSARAVTNTTGNGPFNTLLRSPAVGELSQQLGNTIRFSSGLSGRLRELATLMAGRAWTSSYEWYAHARYALDEGIDPAVVAAIAARETPDLAAMPREDALVWRVSDELLHTRRVTDATYEEALAVLGEQRLWSAVTIAAYYEYVSMLLNVDRYPLPADASAEAAAAARALKPLSGALLYTPPRGAVTPRPRLENREPERALAALGARVASEDELPSAARAAARNALLAEWNKQGSQVDRAGSPVTQPTLVLLRFTSELLNTRFVSDETFAAAREALGERGLVNLIVYMGYANIRCAQQALSGADCAL
jgi:4-carboxymuconolactone decarboxylase